MCRSGFRESEHAALVRVDRLRLQHECIPNLAQQRQCDRDRLALTILAAIALAVTAGCA
jgi:hypothetical protein